MWTILPFSSAFFQQGVINVNYIQKETLISVHITETPFIYLFIFYASDLFLPYAISQVPE
jgi:hypothetical protein